MLVPLLLLSLASAAQPATEPSPDPVQRAVTAVAGDLLAHTPTLSDAQGALCTVQLQRHPGITHTVPLAQVVATAGEKQEPQRVPWMRFWIELTCADASACITLTTESRTTDLPHASMEHREPIGRLRLMLNARDTAGADAAVEHVEALQAACAAEAEPG